MAARHRQRRFRQTAARRTAPKGNGQKQQGAHLRPRRERIAVATLLQADSVVARLELAAGRHRHGFERPPVAGRRQWRPLELAQGAEPAHEASADDRAAVTLGARPERDGELLCRVVLTRATCLDITCAVVHLS